MMSLKSIVAAVALGTALLVAPAAVSAKTTTVKHAKVHAVHSHAKKLHRRAVKHTTLHAKTRKHVKASAKKHVASKTTTGWKHHRSI